MNDDDRRRKSARLRIPVLIIWAMMISFANVSANPEETDWSRARLIVLADMGNEADEEQQMHHLLLNSNEFDIEGLIAVTGKYLRNGPRVDLFWNLIDGYAMAYPNLLKHCTKYPSPSFLRSVAVNGQLGYGIQAVGKHVPSSAGARLITEAVLKDDPRPICIVINAGSNTLAQALIQYQLRHSPEEVDAFVSKIRVFENGSQDNAGAWICANFPQIHWIRSNYQTYCYGGPDPHAGGGPNVWQPYDGTPVGQHQWALEHVFSNHGPFSKYYPLRLWRGGQLVAIEGGGTIPWMGLVNKGLYSVDHPHWGGWSGRFSREKLENFWSRHEDIKVDEAGFAPFHVFGEASDRWTNPETGQVYEGEYAPVWRWRRSMVNNQRARMDWCIEDFENANHHPIAALGSDKSDSIVISNASTGQEFVLDASSSSDPDGDGLAFRWYVYPEAGTYNRPIGIPSPEKATTLISVPHDASGKEIHVILEVVDDSRIVPLYDFRRIVLVIE